MKRPHRPPKLHHPELRGFLAPQRSLRARLLNYGVIVAAIVVASILVLVGLGVLRFPGSGGGSSEPVTVLFVHWTILQGMLNNSTQGWFGPSQINYTGPEGYPTNVSTGERFVVPLVIASFGMPGHWVYSVSAQLPFQVVGASPGLPIFVNTTDDAAFLFTVQAPFTPGLSAGLNMTLNGILPLS